jgi:hypothetical protein
MFSALLRTKSRDAAGRIKPQTQLTIEAIQAMIAEDEAAVAAAEAELRATALDASLINDPFPARGHLDRLREAQDRLEVHRHALAAANEAEEQRKRAAIAAARESAIRAGRQQIALLAKELAGIEVALTNLVQRSARAEDIARTLARVLPAEQPYHELSLLVSANALSREIATELNRVSGLHHGHPAVSKRAAPGAGWPLGFDPEALQPLSVRLTTKLVDHLNSICGKTSQPKPLALPPPEPKVEPPVKDTAPDPASASVVIAQLP